MSIDNVRDNQRSPFLGDGGHAAQNFAETCCLGAIGQFKKPPVSETENRTETEIDLKLPSLLIVADRIQEAKPVKTDGGAKEPSKDEIEQIHGFLEQLGSQNYHQREAATKALRQFGPAALPYIQDELAKSSNAEVQMRCEALINAQVYGGLPPINRLPTTNPIERGKPGGAGGGARDAGAGRGGAGGGAPDAGAAGEAGAGRGGFPVGLMGALMGFNAELPAHPPVTQEEYKKVQEFADGPALRTKRQETIERILKQQPECKNKLSPAYINILKKEQLNLKDIDQLCAWLDADLAITHAEAGEIEKTRELLLKALKRYPSVKETQMFESAMRKAKFPKDDEIYNVVGIGDSRSPLKEKALSPMGR